MLTAGRPAFRTRSGACDTLSRLCVRHVRQRIVFSLAPALRSTTSAAGHPAFVRRLRCYYGTGGVSQPRQFAATIAVRVGD